MTFTSEMGGRRKAAMVARQQSFIDGRCPPDTVAAAMSNFRLIKCDPHVLGATAPEFDCVRLCSNRSPAELRVTLPIAQLEAASHVFKIEQNNYEGGSRIVTSVLPGREVLKLLKRHEAALGRYRVTVAEVAQDSSPSSLERARQARDWQVSYITKRNHQSGYLRAVGRTRDGKKLSPARRDDRGLVDEPTIYYEPKGSAALGLKIYLRRQKLANKEFGDYVTRLEFTLNRSRSVMRHIGGDQLDDLINSDLTGFMDDHLAYETLDYSALGRLFRFKATARKRRLRSPAVRAFDDEEYQARRIGYLVAYGRKNDEMPSQKEVSDDLMLRCLLSPSHLRSCLRNIIKKQHKLALRKNKLTQWKLDKCFSSVSGWKQEQPGERRKRVRLELAGEPVSIGEYGSEVPGTPFAKP